MTITTTEDLMKKVKDIIRRLNEGIKNIFQAWFGETRFALTDEGMLIFFILVPLFYPLLYSFVYTNEVVREVPVVVVDKSHSSLSRRFIRNFDASPDTKVAFFCDNIDEAKDLVGRQEAFGVLYFPSDFQTKVNRMEQSHVSVYCDMSFMLYYKAVFQTATAVAGEVNADIQIERAGNWTERENEVLTQPLDYEEVPIFNTTGGYGNFIIPGVLMLVLQQTLLLGIGLSAGTRRERRLSGNAKVVGDSANGVFTTLLGKALSYLMIYILLAAYLVLIVPRLFGFVSMLHGYDLVCFMLPYLLSCIFFAMTVSFAVRYRENIILIVVFTSVVFLFMSGVSWPQSNIPAFWQGVSSLIPSTFGIRGFVRMNTMGALFGDVMPEYKALWIQTIVYFSLTCLLYAMESRRYNKDCGK